MKLESEDRIHVLESGMDPDRVLEQIAESESQEEPFYVMDVGDILDKFNNWKEKLPDIKPFYAVKCNDSPVILELLAGLGCGFDCASKGEIGRILEMGVAPERIIFANPVKMTSHIKYAARYGVDLMTFDSLCELHKIRANHPNPKLVLRIRVDSNDAQTCLGLKFGCEPSEAGQLLKASGSMGLPVVGISFHVGTGNRETAAWPRAIRAAAAVASQAGHYGHAITLLDIGGGFPGDRGTSIAKISELIKNTIADEWCDFGDDLQVIAEPGRYFVSSAYTLATCVHSVRTKYNNDNNNSASKSRHRHHQSIQKAVDEIGPTGQTDSDAGEEMATSEEEDETVNDDDKEVMYYINDGVYGSFNCILFDHAVKMPIALKELKNRREYETPPGGELENCVIWGPTCDSVDMITDRARLPRLSVGDWMVFRDMGAYTIPVATGFNGFPLPAVHHLVSADDWQKLKGVTDFPQERFTLETPRPIPSQSVRRHQQTNETVQQQRQQPQYQRLTDNGVQPAIASQLDNNQLARLR